ncbi:unnamed protein product [Phytophthora fragariaefolia]|uniref:Unnamed protein product n=1 Tax=Phytophthora fragariaefolia TaxID=1490495 RepID=A0A9W6X9Q5_9STRA|nr:unnamed protein product [Phytophthora fragariaefolia]
MAEQDQMDAILADVIGFMIASDASNAFTQAIESDCPQLLAAEIETLLPPVDPVENTLFGANGTQSTSNTEQISAVRRRELRNAQAAQRRMRYRQKLKNEREALREQEIQLSQQLSVLQQARDEQKKTQVDKMTLNGWRATAMRQKERRIEAEAQQKKLRTAVVGKARLIHQMKALLQRPTVEEKKIKLYPNSCGDEGQNSVLLKTLLEDLDGLYAQTDQILQEMEFKMSSPLEYKPKKTCKQGIDIFDSADATVLPFGFEDMCRATSLLMMTDPASLW